MFELIRNAWKNGRQKSWMRGEWCGASVRIEGSPFSLSGTLFCVDFGWKTEWITWSIKPLHQHSGVGDNTKREQVISRSNLLRNNHTTYPSVVRSPLNKFPCRGAFYLIFANNCLLWIDPSVLFGCSYLPFVFDRIIVCTLVSKTWNQFLGFVRKTFEGENLLQSVHII